MTKKEQITQTIKDLDSMLLAEVTPQAIAVMPHDKISILQHAIKFLKEYEEKQ